MSKMFCKLFGHKWDNASYIRVCRRCPKIEWRSKKSELKPHDKQPVLTKIKKSLTKAVITREYSL